MTDPCFAATLDCSGVLDYPDLSYTIGEPLSGTHWHNPVWSVETVTCPPDFVWTLMYDGGAEIDADLF